MRTVHWAGGCGERISYGLTKVVPSIVGGSPELWEVLTTDKEFTPDAVQVDGGRCVRLLMRIGERNAWVHRDLETKESLHSLNLPLLPSGSLVQLLVSGEAEAVTLFGYVYAGRGPVVPKGAFKCDSCNLKVSTDGEMPPDWCRVMVLHPINATRDLCAGCSYWLWLAMGKKKVQW